MKCINNQIELDDGRKLGYSEFGDLNGFPVINNHGGCLCRLDIEPADVSQKSSAFALFHRTGQGLDFLIRRPIAGCSTVRAMSINSPTN
jgi:hypothetical protein